MNKFLELRKKLILRLIIIELNLYGYLEILEPLFLGSIDTARSQLMKTELTPGTIRAITQASYFLAEHGRGTLNIGGIVGNLNTRLDRSINLEWYNNTGEMKINHNLQYYTSIQLRGSVCPSIFMEGRMEEAPPTREAEGQIIFGYQWQGHGLYGPAISTEGRLLKKSPSMDARALMAVSLDREGTIQLSTNSWGKARVFEEIYNREGLIVSDCMNLGYAMTSAILRICRSVPQFDIVTQGTVFKSSETIGTYGQLLDGDICRGYINLQITRIISGYSGFTILPTAKLRVYTEENGLLVPPRDFLEGCALQAGEIITLNGQPTFGQISLSFSSITQPRISGILPCKKDLYIGTVSIPTLPRVRTEEELMGLQREFWHIGFILNALPSYQHRSGMYGTLQLSERLLVDAMSENHTTMYYEVIPDEVNGGDTYEIITKYHKDVDGIVSIGWRYFGYLIE